MALTGDLRQLHITDIIQLIHSTRKSGTLTVRGERGESRVIFSNGYLVGASHLSNRIRIGTVLVQMKAISPADLKEALDFQRAAGGDRKPLLSTLKQLGRLKDDAAFKALKKLIEITIVELISWTIGTFTFDDTDIAVSPECSYSPGAMEQEMSLDAQMVLMDALRVFDERERDRSAGRNVQPYEEQFAEVLPAEETVSAPPQAPSITADLLGLADLDQLEEKIPKASAVPEVFDPIEIHRQKLREILPDVPLEVLEPLILYLKHASERVGLPDASGRQEAPGRSIILYSADTLLAHATMTACKNDGVMIFAADREDEIDRLISQSQMMKVMPALVFDAPGANGSGLTEENMTALRLRERGRHPQVPMFQLAAKDDYAFTLQSYRDGMRAVIPKPVRDRREAFIADMITFLEAFRSFARGFLHETTIFSESRSMQLVRERIRDLRTTERPESAASVLLDIVSGMFPRSISFFVRKDALVGGQAAGVNTDRSEGPAPAGDLQVPLTGYSVFRDVIESGESFFGECDDEVLSEHLHSEIGPPMRPTIFLLPVKCLGQVTAMLYGDFGKKEVAPVPLETLDILGMHAGLALENAIYRAEILKTQKQ